MVCKIKLMKFTKLFCLVIVCLSTFIATSCKKDEPIVTKASVLTPDVIAKLQTATDKIMMNSQAPGIIAYFGVDGEKEELYITRGVSNLVTNEPMNKDNSWRIGSITKTITSEAVLILADEGKIDLSKPISFYFPEYKIPSGDKITIRMLGNMTSGLYDYTSNMDWYLSYINSNQQKVYTREELAAIVFNNPIQYEPGTRYYYNNSNFLVLGLLIKKVTGKEVIDIFNEKIFQPLGMKNTFWPNTRYLPIPYSHGYTLDNNALIDATNYNPSWGDAAGILISNVSDLKIWAKEMGERELLSDKMKSERFAWVNSDAPGLSSGFGIDKVMDWVGHPGAIFGYNSQIWYNTVKKITVIVTTNSMEGYPTEGVLGEYINILTPFK